MTHRVDNLKIEVEGDKISITSQGGWKNRGATSIIEFDAKAIPNLIERLKEIQMERIGKW